MSGFICDHRRVFVFQRVARVEKSVTIQQHFEQYARKQTRLELKYVGNCVAKTVLFESANQFSLEELCRPQYILKYFSKPCRPSDPLENLKFCSSVEEFKLNRGLPRGTGK